MKFPSALYPTVGTPVGAELAPMTVLVADPNRTIDSYDTSTRCGGPESQSCHLQGGNDTASVPQSPGESRTLSSMLSFRVLS